MIIFQEKNLEDVLHRNTTWCDIARDLGVYDKYNKMIPILIRRLDELCIDYTFLDNIPLRRKEGHSRNMYTKFTDEEIFKKSILKFRWGCKIIPHLNFKYFFVTILTNLILYGKMYKHCN